MATRNRRRSRCSARIRSIMRSKYGTRRDRASARLATQPEPIRSRERRATVAWTIWWDTERRPGTGRWNVASAQTEAGALDRAHHFARLGCIVYAIRNPDGAVYMDEAQLGARFGGETKTSAADSRREGDRRGCSARALLLVKGPNARAQRRRPERRALLGPARKLTSVVERHQSARGFIPQRQPGASHAGLQAEAFRLAQLGILREAVPQPIIRNPARQVVDMVEADVAGHPVQDPRQIIERGALECRRLEGPACPAIPISLLALMLDVEEPDADRSGEQDNRQISNEE